VKDAEHERTQTQAAGQPLRAVIARCAVPKYSFQAKQIGLKTTRRRRAVVASDGADERGPGGERRGSTI
jgi:hypothetical protein